MGKAFICKQILLTNYSRKCISLENLYLYFGALRVNLALGTQETCTLYTSYHYKNLTEDANDF